MKFDKAQIIVLVVGIAILLTWDPVCKYMGWFQVPVETPKTAPAATSAPAAPATAAAPKALPAAPAAAAPAASKSPAQAASSKKIRSVAPMAPVEVSNTRLKLLIDPVSASVLDFIVPGYKSADLKETIRLSQNLHSSLAFTRLVPDPFGAMPAVIDVKTAKSENGLKVVRKLQFPDGGIVRIENQWLLENQSCNITCKVLVVNESSAPRNFTGYGFTGASMSSWAKVSGDNVRTPSHRLDYMTGKGKFKDIAADDDEEDFRAADGTLVEWAGVSNKYFCILLGGTQPFSL